MDGFSRRLSESLTLEDMYKTLMMDSEHDNTVGNILLHGNEVPIYNDDNPEVENAVNVDTKIYDDEKRIPEREKPSSWNVEVAAIGNDEPSIESNKSISSESNQSLMTDVDDDQDMPSNDERHFQQPIKRKSNSEIHVDDDDVKLISNGEVIISNNLPSQSKYETAEEINPDETDNDENSLDISNSEHEQPYTLSDEELDAILDETVSAPDSSDGVRSSDINPPIVDLISQPEENTEVESMLKVNEVEEDVMKNEENLDNCARTRSSKDIGGMDDLMNGQVIVNATAINNQDDPNYCDTIVANPEKGVTRNCTARDEEVGDGKNLEFTNSFADNNTVKIEMNSLKEQSNGKQYKSEEMIDNNIYGERYDHHDNHNILHNRCCLVLIAFTFLLAIAALVIALINMATKCRCDSFNAINSDLRMLMTERSLKQRCPVGWTVSNGSCYGMSHLPKANFTDAENACAQFGGYVLSLETKNENNFVREHILCPRYSQLGRDEPVYIGLMNDTVNYRWSSGNTYVYTNLQVTNVRNKCVKIGKNGTWSDVNCAEKLNFFCELRLLKEPMKC